MPYDPLQQLRMIPEPWPTLRQGADGWWVRLLRRVLARHGYGEPAWADPRVTSDVPSEFDAELAQHVMKFQREHGLFVDGVVGRMTWQSLAQVSLVKTRTVEIEHTPRHATPADEARIRGLIVNYAKLLQALDVHEHGPNRGEVVDALQRHAAGQVGYAWCVAFCDFVVEQAYSALGLKVPLDIGVSSSGLVRKARGRARLKLEADDVQPGDIMVLRGGPTGYKHAGIVIGVQPNGDLQSPGKFLRTIEGNTNIAGSPEGDGVYLKTRDPRTTPMVFVDVAS